jgi:hypothetical protein
MSDPETHGPPTSGTAPGRAGGWMAATVVLLLAVVGLGAWALSLRSENEDKDATIAAQQHLPRARQVRDQLEPVLAAVTEPRAFSSCNVSFDAVVVDRDPQRPAAHRGSQPRRFVAVRARQTRERVDSGGVPVLPRTRLTSQT